MSPRRWTATALVMAGAAWALLALGPDAGQTRSAFTDPQRLVDAAGPDALLVPVVAAAGWLCWTWGAVGLLLTALSALPGPTGRAAHRALLALLPAAARRLAAAAVGLTLTTGAPLLVPASSDVPLVTSAVSHPVDALVDGTGPAAAPPTVAPPDWPDAPAGPPPPGLPATTDRVVLRGDCLWDIAEAWLAAAPGAGDRAGTGPTDAQVLAAVRAWWQTNAAVIGPDPDLLLPGQVLTPPPR